MQTTSGATTINAGRGNDTITVGKAVPVSGTMALTVLDIQGALTVHGDEGTDTLTVDDTADLAFISGRLTETALTGLRMGPGGIAYGASVEDMTVILGDGGAFFNIEATLATVNTTVQTGANHTGSPWGVMAGWMALPGL